MKKASYFEAFFMISKNKIMSYKYMVLAFGA